MKRLDQLRAKFAEKKRRSEELRAVDTAAMTAEQAAELRAVIAELKGIADDIDAEIQAIEIESRNSGAEQNHETTISVPDQPVYRGSAASAFGQQLADVSILSNPANRGSADEKRAKTRLEENTKRAFSLIEKRSGQEPSKEFREKSMAPIYNPEARAAGTGMIQGIGSEGGFLLQSETSIDLMTHGFNNSAILSRCQKRTLTGSESLEIVGLDETSRATGSRGGGIRVYTDAELSQMTSSMTKFEKIKLAPERLTGLFYASDKILMNATFLGQEMSQLFREEFAFKTQDLIMEGTGAGQALGLKNAACVVEIAKEAGQAAQTIVTQNVLKMWQRFYASGAAPIWVANRNTLLQLLTLTYDVGTGGELAKLFVPPRMAGETGSMLGYPVEFIEQAETLGTAGDLQLCDFSQYVVVDYGDINEASSVHFKFDNAQTTFRFIYYFDGQPRWISAITPFKGSSDTLSPLVRLATRA